MAGNGEDDGSDIVDTISNPDNNGKNSDNNGRSGNNGSNRGNDGPSGGDDDPSGGDDGLGVSSNSGNNRRKRRRLETFDLKESIPTGNSVLYGRDRNAPIMTLNDQLQRFTVNDILNNKKRNWP